MILNTNDSRNKDRIMEDYTIKKESTHSREMSAMDFESSLMDMEISKISDSRASKRMTSFYSQGVFSVEIETPNDNMLLAFRSVSNFMIGCFWMILTVS